MTLWVREEEDHSLDLDLLESRRRDIGTRRLFNFVLTLLSNVLSQIQGEDDGTVWVNNIANGNMLSLDVITVSLSKDSTPQLFLSTLPSLVTETLE